MSPVCPPDAAALKGHSALLKLLLSAVPKAATTRNSQQQLPAHLAAFQGQAAVLGVLLDAAPDTALMADEDGDTPLHLAALGGHTAAVELLLAAAPEAALLRRRGGATSTHVACDSGHEAVVARLLAAEPCTATLALDGTNGGVTPAHVAAARGRIQILRRLLAVAPNADAIRDARYERCGLAGAPACRGSPHGPQTGLSMKFMPSRRLSVQRPHSPGPRPAVKPDRGCRLPAGAPPAAPALSGRGTGSLRAHIG